MVLQQFYLNCLAHASYLIGDEQTRTAAVVDPQRDIGIYLDDAARRGMTIRHVFLTHFHADFIAGHLELRDRTGADIYLGAAARAEYAFRPMKNGDAVEFGHVRLQALETPGHTAESISMLVFDLERDSAHPAAALTGDTLFIGDVGRPDLRASLGWSASALGAMLYDSLWQKLLPLPDGTLVYPAHGAGSLCGKHLSKETVSTIGEQRRTNYALQPMSREEFVALVTADQPDAPAYFTYDAVLNSKERATLDTVLSKQLTPLSLEQTIALTAAGAQLLDVREAMDFAQGHVIGSINIGLGGQYATWAGTFLDRERPIVIIAEPAREMEAAVRLGRIGFDHVAGYLAGGVQAIEARPDLLGATVHKTPEEALAEFSAGMSAFLDIRTPAERHEKHIDGSVWIPLTQLGARLRDVAGHGSVIVHCAGGYRSSIAASLLKHAGLPGVSELAGGLAAWEANKLTLIKS